MAWMAAVPPEAAPERLTAILRHAGVVGSVEVVDVAVETSRDTLVSRIARLRRDLTLVHGDAHVWNALIPRHPALGDVRLIDWDGWRVDTATDDLAYMLALHWYPEWRRRHERDSLERYHDTLLAGGVRRYSLDALWQDYRYSVLWQITTPMWQANHGLPPVVWWNGLERIMLAVHDLDCLDLLGST